MTTSPLPDQRKTISDWLYRTFRVDISDSDFDPARALLVALGCEADGCEAGWVWPTNDPAHRFACNACRPSAEKPDVSMWLNAFSCVKPSDKFAVEVGREVVQHLMNGRPKVEPLEPFRRVVIEVKCS